MLSIRHLWARLRPLAIVAVAAAWGAVIGYYAGMGGNWDPVVATVSGALLFGGLVAADIILQWRCTLALDHLMLTTTQEKVTGGCAFVAIPMIGFVPGKPKAPA